MTSNTYLQYFNAYFISKCTNVVNYHVTEIITLQIELLLRIFLS